MKRLLFFLCIAVYSSLFSQEEPDWKFYLAFEDATGAKDTVWIAMDEEGTFEQDVQFGEVPQNMNEDEFHVYFSLDTGKSDIFVLPLVLPGLEALVNAENHTYPITLSWDTTLFNAPILMNSPEGPVINPLLDNAYFFPGYNMLFEESVEMPTFWWGSQEHFPLWVTFFRGFGDPLSLTDNEGKSKFNVSPNPVQNVLTLQNAESVKSIRIFDMNGRVVSESDYTNLQVDVSALHEGIYLLEIGTPTGSSVVKFIKVD